MPTDTDGGALRCPRGGLAGGPTGSSSPSSQLQQHGIEDSSGAASSPNSASPVRQHRGDETAEVKEPAAASSSSSTAPPAAAAGDSQQEPATADETGQEHDQKEELGRSPGERAFFKLLHAELKKATHFFDKAQQEFAIREERVREGMEIMKQPNSIMVSEKWSLLARSIFRLYKDLLLLETFAIMTYCSFSKILKKHDKVTGYNTRAAFMQNVVNKANFASYPMVLEMIARCERLYEDVSNRLVQEGKQLLYEDERLFINMISRLNEQVLNTEDGEGERVVEGRSSRSASTKGEIPPAAGHESVAVSMLRTLVQEHADHAKAAQVSEGHEGVDKGRKRSAGGTPAGRKVSSAEDATTASSPITAKRPKKAV